MENSQGHQSQVTSVKTLKENIEDTIERVGGGYLEEDNALNFIDKTSCFIYFFTVQQSFNLNSPQIEKFLTGLNGKSKQKAWYKEQAKGPKTVIEKLLYIGETTNISTREHSHKMFRKLHNNRYKNAQKFFYIASVSVDETIQTTSISGCTEDKVIETPIEVFVRLN